MVFKGWCKESIRPFSSSLFRPTSTLLYLLRHLVVDLVSVTKPFSVFFSDPNKPVDVQQYLKSTWPEYDMTSQKYINITPDLGTDTVQERFAARQVQFWTKLIPTIERAVNQTDQSAY